MQAGCSRGAAGRGGWPNLGGGLQFYFEMPLRGLLGGAPEAETVSKKAEPRLCQAPHYEEADFDGMDHKQLRSAAKALHVNQKQSNDALREACKRAARELKIQRGVEWLDARA